MESPSSTGACFLAEWYRSESAERSVEPTIATLDDAAAEVSASGTPVRLIALFAMPNDDLLFGVFTADSAQTVAHACDRAGMSAQRLTSASEVHFRT